jgi:hypothetical protein
MEFNEVKTEINEFESLRKAKNIGEISFLKFRKIPVKKIVTYDNKSTFWFENKNKESDNVLAEYYTKDYIEYFDVIQQTRKELFTLLNKDK